MWQTQLAIPLNGRISRQFAPNFDWARVPLHYRARHPRPVGRRGKITRNPAVGMANCWQDGACHAVDWATRLLTASPALGPDLVELRRIGGAGIETVCVRPHRRRIRKDGPPLNGLSREARDLRDRQKVTDFIGKRQG
jgi:hypothetical protein